MNLFMDWEKRTLEKFSSAFTLSDMEIFVFPELFYPLVLANILSPIIWKWREDAWFKDIHKKSLTYKINRIKQFIMDHYVFNLDLDTWGLTTKEREIERFKNFIDIDILQKSNALFGYEGDKYYFDMDIRKHFGLDKFTTNVIPYWKTETVEAMTAFRFKEGYNRGAGECVSLSALYAAACFIVGEIPLGKIFLVATPLHSQNFINIGDGVLTNNRRIVTKNMWFNGSALSTKARRALEKEKVTIVSHISGYIHTLFEKATISLNEYNHFTDKLRLYLKTELTPAIFINFLRYDMTFKKCFQYMYLINGKKHYIALEKIFEYEHLSKNNFSEKSKVALLNDIETEEFQHFPLEGRICFNDLENYLADKKQLSFDEIRDYFMSHALETKCNNVQNIEFMFSELKSFITVEPELPAVDKDFKTDEQLKISTELSRNEILEMIINKSQVNENALLALYAYRQMDLIDWNPFIKAAIERNPVSVEGFNGKNIDEIYSTLSEWSNDSIYSEQRLAQPDEVWNFNRGDGIEKAILLAGILYNEFKIHDSIIRINKNEVVLTCSEKKFQFSSEKGLTKEIYLNKIL